MQRKNIAEEIVLSVFFPSVQQQKEKKEKYKTKMLQLLAFLLFQMLNLPLNDVCTDILIKKLDRDMDGQIDFGSVDLLSLF